MMHCVVKGMHYLMMRCVVMQRVVLRALALVRALHPTLHATQAEHQRVRHCAVQAMAMAQIHQRWGQQRHHVNHHGAMEGTSCCDTENDVRVRWLETLIG